MEEERLKDSKEWRKWGPYLSERQWGTVREDCSTDGNCWDDFTHDQAMYRAYRWGEDGLLGISDEQCRLCLSLALWNERDPILKERLYGLTNSQGNHGEDVKELYYYLDNTPTHSYMKALYKYPQGEFPYRKLEEENGLRTVYDREYELLDTGIFKDKGYFDVQAEYCKASPTDVLGRYTVTNHGPEKATVHVLPTLWYRNVWSWGPCDAALDWKPTLHIDNDGRVICQHPELGEETSTSFEQKEPPAKRKRKRSASDTPTIKKRKVETKSAYVYEVDTDQNGAAPAIIFTENETNYEKMDAGGKKNVSKYVKDLFHEYVIKGKKEAVHKSKGTKCAANYICTLEPGQSAVIKVRLRQTAESLSSVSFSDELFDAVFKQRIQEADEFYSKFVLFPHPDLLRQACAGLLWSKEFYYLIQKEWSAHKKQVQSQSQETTDPTKSITIANEEWDHLYNKDIISMPDKWEFPWYAAWDLALQSIAFAKIDVQFAMNQLELLLQDGYIHPDGRIPAFEFNFSDTNPPVHAYAVLKVFRKSQDIAFLKRCFTKLQSNFQWWMENKSIGERKLFTGGFLGLDNISVFDRSDPPIKEGFHLAQADATAWMAMYSLNMVDMSVILARQDITGTEEYQDMAVKYLEYFLEISEDMNRGLWNSEDGFYYDHIISNNSLQSKPLSIKSMVGLVALFASTFLRRTDLQTLSKLQAYLAENGDNLRSSVHISCSFQANGDIFLSLVNKEQISRILAYVMNEETFLSPFGLRSLSKEYKQKPYCLREEEWRDCVDFGSQPSRLILHPAYSIDYQPGESCCALFGGNSNWRGPVWMPVNYLLIDSLRRLGDFYGSALKVECPRSGRTCRGKHPSSKNVIPQQTLGLGNVAKGLASKLRRLFVPGAQNQRPCHGSDTVYATEPDFKDLCLFYEYFHGDTGRGCGASHQTGWTALVCTLMDR